MKYLPLLALLALGCQDKPTPNTDPTTPASGASTPKPADPSGRLAGSVNALVAGKAALAHVPKEAEVVLLTANVQDAIKALGREEVLKAIPQEYAMAATEIRKETGFDLLDPSQWKNIGVQADGPGGLFVMARTLTFGFMVTLADVKTFKGWLSSKKPGGEPLQIDGATVYPGGWGPAMVIKNDVLYLIGADRNYFAEAWAITLASLDAANSLAQDTRIKTAAQTLGYGRHIGGFVDTQRVVDGVIAAEMRQAGPEIPALIANARKAGRTEAAQRIERRMNRRRGDMGEAMAIGAIKGMIAGGLGPMVLGIEVEGAAIRLKAHLEATSVALPRRLLNARKHSGAIGTLAGPKAAMMADGELDMAQAMSVLNTLMLTAGGEFGRIERGIREEIGLDLKTQIIPTFTGELGGAMLIQDVEAQGEKKMGMTLFAGVDAKKFQVVMDALLQHRMLSKMLTKSGERYTLQNPWRPIVIERKGTQVVITTEPTSIDRAPGRTPAKHLGPSLSALMGRTGTMATWAMDLAPIASMFLMAFSSWDMPPPLNRSDDPAIKALIAKRAELTEQIKTAKAAMQKTQLKAGMDMLSPLGHIALVIEENKTGLLLEGGLFTRGPYLKAAANFAKQATTIEARMRTARQPVRDLKDQRREIDTRLRSPTPSRPMPMKMPAAQPAPRQLKEMAK